MAKEQKRPLITELTQGKELANQLKDHLDKSMSPETCEFLLEKILSSYEKALSILNWRSALVEEASEPVDSLEYQCNKNVSKKRKTMATWSEQVKVCSGTMVEGPLSDGYSWRKYGQKEILGTHHPRAYYRCTHRNAQGCLATKQVQRSDEDLSVFEVSYRGRHTCIQANQLSEALALVEEKPKRDIQDSKITQEMYSNNGFGFKSEATETKTCEEEIFNSFSFPTTPIESENVGELFFLGGDSPSFISDAQNLSCSSSDFNEMINSTSNSSMNSPIVDWDFLLDHVDFNANFPLDTTDSEIFC